MSKDKGKTPDEIIKEGDLFDLGTYLYFLDLNDPEKADEYLDVTVAETEKTNVYKDVQKFFLANQQYAKDMAYLNHVARDVGDELTSICMDGYRHLLRLEFDNRGNQGFISAKNYLARVQEKGILTKDDAKTIYVKVDTVHSRHKKELRSGEKDSDRAKNIDEIINNMLKGADYDVADSIYTELNALKKLSIKVEDEAKRSEFIVAMFKARGYDKKLMESIQTTYGLTFSK